MAKIIPISSKTRNRNSEINNRRKELKTKRRLNTILVLMRTLLIISFAGGAFWLLTLPHWVIRSSDEITVKGNKFLSENEVKKLIPLSYPQPLLTLSIEDLKENLKAKIPFEDIVINREILPPKITIKVLERQPVAVAFAPVVSPKNKKVKFTKIGYLDSKGILVSSEFYQNLKDDKKLLPNLEIVGNYNHYSPYWEDLYPLINSSSIKITKINWQNPNNIILRTKLGTVYMGAYTSQFPQKLTLLTKIKQLPQKVNLNEIIYIDLSDPDFPSIKEKKPPKEKSEQKK